MKKFISILSIIAILCLSVVFVTACGDKDGDDNHVDYVSELKLDMNSNTLKEEVEVRNHVDGDTVHFYVDKSIVATGILKGRFLAINTPESTGQVEDYGHTASRFTKNALKEAVSIIIESDDDKWNVDSTGDRYLVWVWYKPSEGAEYRNLNVEILQNGLAVASNTAQNRYGDIAMNALNQAKEEKLYVHSGVKDPEIYDGPTVSLSIKDLRTNIEDYNTIKVAIEGVVVQNNDATAYVESYDQATDTYYGMTVYYGYSLSGPGIDILSIGNKVRVIGIVQYYETGDTYQISDVKYRQFVTNDPDNLVLLSEGNAPAYDLIDANVFANGKKVINGKEFPITNLMLSASISMENLTVTSVYTTNNGGNNDGAMTLTCTAEDGTTISVRTTKLYDENNKLITASAYKGKTINVKGLVDYFDGEYQIKVFHPKYITIVE